MSSAKQIRLKHAAPFAWMAIGADANGKTALQDQPIPILRVRKGKTYAPRTGLYQDTLESSAAVGRKDWWQAPGKKLDTWRAGLVPGGIAALRFFKEDGTKNGSTGDWLGVYRIQAVTLGDFEISIAFDPERLWSVKQ